ncbi:hypothetical protein L2E82_20377 [Cichorium intybus]|uniref:Uncharacterized protein n=1 Tax=Cichorium intybus TaxID=13427 RepID=A0ACB9DTJ6_CICIN|nr:hypothetical protein L2E82_20377 [Cichorium intybus]
MYILLYRWILSTLIEVNDSNLTTDIKFTTTSSGNRIATSSGLSVSSFKFALIRGDVAGAILASGKVWF